MDIIQNTGPKSERDPRDGLIRLGIVSAVGGVLIGVIGAYFRYALELSTQWLLTVIEWAHQFPVWGWWIPLLIGAFGAGIARLMVRGTPLASGSGVQHVEAVMRGEATPAPFRVLPIKFFGGILALGSGLALGREGPTVQMGATIGQALVKRCKMGGDDLEDVQAALAGAGLAVAFNAPMGGSIFVFEEVARRFRLRLVLATLIGGSMAVAVSRLIMGDAPVFIVSNILAPTFASLIPYFIFGITLGYLGVLYNRAVIRSMDIFASLKKIPLELRAALVGAIVGLIGWFAPNLIGGGEGFSQVVLNGGLPLGMLLITFVVRWFLGPFSYSAGTPGGLFAPLLLVGAAYGALFAGGVDVLLPGLGLPAVSFAIVGMAAFFSAVVRAPLTGIILIVEMTATTGLLVPMLLASFAAVLTATFLGGPPIYDTLRERMLAAQKARPQV